VSVAVTISSVSFVLHLVCVMSGNVNQ
jgi:hypothetical protein